MNFRNLKSSPKSFPLKPKIYHLKPSSGFTLVEMLVVISIIGILYLVVFGSVSDSKARGRDSKRIADISVIQLALERYYDENGDYPTALTSFDDSVPKIDSQGTNYLYDCTLSCQSYNLSAQLELDNPILIDDVIISNGLQYDVKPKF